MTQTTELPTSTWQGSFKIYGIELKCHVLSDGQRIIEGEGLEKLFEAMSAGGWGQILDHEEINKFAKWQKGIEQ